MDKKLNVPVEYSKQTKHEVMIVICNWFFKVIVWFFLYFKKTGTGGVQIKMNTTQSQSREGVTSNILILNVETFI